MSTETDTTSEVARVLGRTVLGLHPEPGPKRDEMIREAAAMLAEAGLLDDAARPEGIERWEVALALTPYMDTQTRYRATADVWALITRMTLAQEAQIAAQEPAGATQGGSGGSRASGGSCARCGARITLPANDPENREMAVCAPCEITVLKEGYRTARAQVEAIRAAITREAAHGEAITRCNLVAGRFQTVLDSVTAP